MQKTRAGSHLAEPLKLLAKLQSAGVAFRSQPDGSVKVRKEGGLSPQETQDLIANREALEALCIYTELSAYALIDKALKYMNEHADKNSGKQAHDKYIEQINTAVAEKNMPALRWYVRKMVTESVRSSK